MGELTIQLVVLLQYPPGYIFAATTQIDAPNNVPPTP